MNEAKAIHTHHDIPADFKFKVAFDSVKKASEAITEIRGISSQLHNTHDALRVIDNFESNDPMGHILKIICNTLDDLTNQLDEELVEVNMHNKMVKELMLGAS